MPRKWSRELILETIKNLKEQGIDLSAGFVSKNHITLFTAASSPRFFGGWGQAVREAGIDYDQILKEGKLRRNRLLRKWSKTSVLEELRKAQALNLLMAYRDRMDLYSAARREFGSWQKALAQAGLKPKKYSAKNLKPIAENNHWLT